MEKKIKKLQLRKETIAVLNGEKMAHIVGGGSGFTEHPPCAEHAEWIILTNNPGGGECRCQEDYVGDPYVLCQPVYTDSDRLCSRTCPNSVGCRFSLDVC